MLYEVITRHDLDSLAQRHLGWKTISYDDVTGKGAARIPAAPVLSPREVVARNNFV